ncbi:UEV domain-containing protein [Flagelloscypha sp. PMI_526]|nr:UEV domain-containing protein [Flagelloscypha sp. PMI_526]
MNQATASWLSDNVQLYSESRRVYADIEAALSRVPTLRLKSEVYTYDDGRTQLLICIHGLLPISFRNATYNIPLALWLPLDYPRSPPISYVVPTPDMLVRPGKFLDPSGRSSIPYLHDWPQKPEAFSLQGLVESLQQHFSAEPPVYAKPKSPPPPRPQSVHHSPHPSLDRPMLPPKPPTFGPAPLPRQSTPSSSIPYGPRQDPFAQQPPPVQAWTPSPPAPVQSPPLHPPPQHLPPAQWTQPQPQSHVGLVPHHQQYPLPPQAVPQPPPPNLLDGDLPTESPQPQPINTPLPPRPPNPELLHLHAQVHHKLTSELASITEAMRADAERLRSQQASLLAGEPAIRDEMARLEAVRDVCRTVGSRLSATVEQAERNVFELRRKGDPEVDELVCSTSIVHNQLINLVAEDNAIEDTIYHLHRALNTGRIDLDRFLRTTRVLAEEQFMKRALIEKIQTGLHTH